MTRLRALVAIVLVGALATASSACSASGDARVNVAAAADLRYALDEVIAIAEETNPGVDYAVTYGSSGQFLQQIENGAPFDIYLSADLTYPQKLVDAGRVSETFTYAVGRLVLWVPEGSPLNLRDGLDVLRDAQRISIANPEHAPYGRAAVAAMERAGVYEDVRPRLVLGENVAQAAEFVTTGNADAGIVALSLVLSDPLREVGTWWEIPLEDFPTIVQGGALLTDSPGAQALRDAITSAEGRDILARYGFILPED
jgi:molybdate transport system substrate-binding protein